MPITRRHFGGVAGGALASVLLVDGCGPSTASRPADDGRLTARPRAGVPTSAAGERTLGLDSRRDAILRLPSPITAPLPLVVLLHGAGGSADGVLQHLGSAPEDAGVAVLAPDARGSSWDGLRNRFGPDVAFLDRALGRVFEIVAVDPARVAIGGFSDGATYALSLGLINGDLFTHVVAFSPGFVIDGTAHGRPRVFISHGTADRILPIDRCSRAIVPGLRRRGYEVVFREFDGGHDIPEDIAREGMQWLATPQK